MKQLQSTQPTPSDNEKSSCNTAWSLQRLDQERDKFDKPFRKLLKKFNYYFCRYSIYFCRYRNHFCKNSSFKSLWNHTCPKVWIKKNPTKAINLYRNSNKAMLLCTYKILKRVPNSIVCFNSFFNIQLCTNFVQGKKIWKRKIILLKLK